MRLVVGRRVAGALGVVGFLAAVVSVPASGSPERGSTVAKEGVSSLSYAPKPFYDDLSRMRVRFTTTGRAGPGRHYIVSLLIVGPDAFGGASNGCAYLASSKGLPRGVRPVRILGAPGRTYVVWLHAGAGIGSTGYFCHGRANLRVRTNSIRNPSQAKLREFLGLDFRVRPAP